MVAVTDQTNPWSQAAVEPPFEVTLPFPVAWVDNTPVAALVVTDGAVAPPPMKYLGIGLPLFSYHQHK